MNAFIAWLINVLLLFIGYVLFRLLLPSLTPKDDLEKDNEKP